MTSERKPKPGDRVVLYQLPRGFVDDLPDEDKRAIAEVLGKPVLLNEYDDTGRAEIEFTDANGVIHYLYVTPACIRPTE